MRAALLAAALLPVGVLLGAAGDPARGRTIVLDRPRGLCTLCHAVPGAVSPAGDLGPDLSGVGARTDPAALRRRVADPRSLNPDTIMPAFGPAPGGARVGAAWRGRPILSSGEIDDVVAFLATLRE